MKHVFSLTKISMALLALTLLGTSCKKERSESTEPTPSSGKLKKLTGQDGELELAYNQNGTVKTLTVSDEFVTGGNVTTYDVTYAGDKITQLKGDDQSVMVPQYSGGNLASVEVKDATGDVQYTAAYNYDGNVLKSVEMQTTFGFALKFDFTVDANGNTTRSRASILNPATNTYEVTGWTDMQYDSKANPLHDLKTLMSIFLQPIAKNNVIKEVERDETGQVTETTTYEYKYNNKNMPASATLVKTPADGLPVMTTLSYLYQ